MVEAMIPPNPAKLAENPEATARLESDTMLVGHEAISNKSNDSRQSKTHLFCSMLTIMGI